MLTTPAVTIEKIPGKNVFLIEQNGDFNIVDVEDPVATFQTKELYDVLFVTDSGVMVVQEKESKIYIVEGEEKHLIGKVKGKILYIKERPNGFLTGTVDEGDIVNLFLHNIYDNRVYLLILEGEDCLKLKANPILEYILLYSPQN